MLQNNGGCNATLVCTACGREYGGESLGAWRLACDAEREHGPALLRAKYAPAAAAVPPRPARRGTLADYGAALPLGGSTAVARATGAPVAFRSEGLGAHLGLAELWISFSGWWPERNARLASCTFKELEAAAIASRLEMLPASRQVVVASAGNTARAFAQAFSRPGNTRRVVLVVPESAVDVLWSPEPFSGNDAVKLVTVAGGGDYADAIALGNTIVSALPAVFVAEGGARNTSRRDGMAVALTAAAVAAAEAHGESVVRPPDHYFQAIGSGTGGVAAWEAALRLAASAGAAPCTMKLHLSQNAPFTPMVDAWAAHSRELPRYCSDAEQGRRLAAAVSAQVLTNRAPPYAITGGVFDALDSCQGSRCYAVTNEEARAAADLFERLENIDIDPAAAVAVASLITAVRENAVHSNDRIVLNVTGGGAKRLRADHSGTLHYLTPSFSVPLADITNAEFILKHLCC